MGRYYTNINIDGHTYKAHRLAWLYINNEWVEFIDHIDDDGQNNANRNLRPTSRSQNGANSYKVNRGVFWDRNKYRAAIRVDDNLIYLGRFDLYEDAQAAYNTAADKYFGSFARCNRVERRI